MSAGGHLRDALDATLDATVVLGFSRVGYRLRSRLYEWDEPATDLAGRTIVVTGGTSGLGEACAVQLARAGAHVVIVGRDADRNDRARDRIAGASGSDDVDAVAADVSDLDRVRDLATRITSEHDRLDALVHNAGALLDDYTLTAQGLETTVAAHVVGPYLLTDLLLPVLRSTPRSRVVTVSSGGMYTERLDVSALEPDPGSYDGTTAYARAKRAQVVLNEEWGRRHDGVWPVFQAMHPGWADTPGLRDALPGFARLMGPLLRTPDEGADTVTWLAAGEPATSSTGLFWLDRRPRRTVYLPRTSTPPGEASRLWHWVRHRAGLGDPAS